MHPNEIHRIETQNATRSPNGKVDVETKECFNKDGESNLPQSFTRRHHSERFIPRQGKTKQATIQAFAAPPNGFTPLTIGVFSFAILVGAIIDLVTAGPLSDWISMKLTRRNNGIREPEMRLPTMIPYFIFMLIGNFVTAFG